MRLNRGIFFSDSFNLILRSADILWQTGLSCFPYIVEGFFLLKALLPHDQFFRKNKCPLLKKCFEPKQFLLNLVPLAAFIRSTVVEFRAYTHKSMRRYLLKCFTHILQQRRCSY